MEFLRNGLLTTPVESRVSFENLLILALENMVSV